jgi:hypothetical protein
MLKLYFLLILLLGISSCAEPERKLDVLKEISTPVLHTIHYPHFPTPPIDTAFLEIQHKISHTMAYCDYCGPTREIEFHFDSTGSLLASSIGPWIRNSIAVFPEYTVFVVYSPENPAPSFFFTENISDHCYYYNAETKKLQKLPYDKLKCASEGLIGVSKRTDQKKDSYRIQYAFLNKKLEPICSFIYDDVEPFEYGVAVVEKEDKIGVLNKAGREIIPCKYESIEVLESKRIQAQKLNYKFDLFTLKGRLIRKNYSERRY